MAISRALDLLWAWAPLASIDVMVGAASGLFPSIPLPYVRGIAVFFQRLRHQPCTPIPTESTPCPPATITRDERGTGPSPHHFSHFTTNAPLDLVAPAGEDYHMEVEDADTEITDREAAALLGPPSEDGDTEPGVVPPLTPTRAEAAL